jgi:hypothetical protein
MPSNSAGESIFPIVPPQVKERNWSFHALYLHIVNLSPRLLYATTTYLSVFLMNFIRSLLPLFYTKKRNEQVRVTSAIIH